MPLLESGTNSQKLWTKVAALFKNMRWVNKKIGAVNDKFNDNADWLKSKNLFDGTVEHLTTLDGLTFASYVEPLETIAVIKVEPNKTYTMTKALSNRSIVCFTRDYPALNGPIINWPTSIDNTRTEQTVTVPTNANYMVVFINFDNGTSPISAKEAINSLQVEEGSIATPYQPYIMSNVELTNDLNAGRLVVKKNESLNTYFMGMLISGKGVIVPNNMVGAEIASIQKMEVTTDTGETYEIPNPQLFIITKDCAGYVIGGTFDKPEKGFYANKAYKMYMEFRTK